MLQWKSPTPRRSENSQVKKVDERKTEKGGFPTIGSNRRDPRKFPLNGLPDRYRIPTQRKDECCGKRGVYRG